MWHLFLQNDEGIIDLFEALLAADPDVTLLSLSKCTGCKRCGHESGRAGAVAHHTKANPCPLCPPGDHGTACCAAHSGPCQCAFHAKADERRVERLAQHLRQDPSLVARVRDLIAVFEREKAAAAAFVRQELAQRGMAPGEKFRWLHRPHMPSIQADMRSVGAEGLTWSSSTLRSKLIPALLEWDFRAGPEAESGVEFRPSSIKKVQGRGDEGSQWRYLVQWERLQGKDVDTLSKLTPLKSSDAPGPSRGNGEDSEDNSSEPVSVEEFDAAWLERTTSTVHRAVRISTLRAVWPSLDTAWQAKSTPAPRTNGKRSKAATLQRKLKDGRGPMDAFVVRRHPADPAPAATAGKWSEEVPGSSKPGHGRGLLGAFGSESPQLSAEASPSKRQRTPPPSRQRGGLVINSCAQSMAIMSELLTSARGLKTAPRTGDRGATRTMEQQRLQRRGAEVHALFTGANGTSEERKAEETIDLTAGSGEGASPPVGGASARRMRRKAGALAGRETRENEDVVDLTDV